MNHKQAEDKLTRCHHALRDVLDDSNHHYVLLITDKQGRNIYQASSTSQRESAKIILYAAKKIKDRMQ